nr:hypothetical protein GCM10025730_41690 [Promicromonospora thailandica]
MRVLVQLDGVHPRAGHLGGDGQRDGSGAGAQVDDDGARAVPLGRHLRGLVDGDLRHLLGLGPRHEDARPHGQLEVAERGAAGEVLQRLARGAPGDQRTELAGGRLRDVAPQDRQPAHLGPVHAEHVRQQRLRVGPR